VPAGVLLGASAWLALPLAARRIAPRTAAGAGLVGVVLTVLTHGPAAVYHFALVGTAVLVVSLRLHAGRATAAVYAVALVVVFAAAVPLTGPWLLVWVPYAAAGIAVGEVAAARRAAQAAEQRRAGERAALQERVRIAREMHDVVTHAVSLMVVQAEAGAAVVRSSPERAEKALDAIGAAGRDAMVQLRRTLGLLKQEQDEGIRTPQPSVAAIPDLVDQVRATGLTASYSVAGAPGPLTAEAEAAAYRIVQEALTNTLKHARADSVAVALNWGDRLVITVRDDGTGGRPSVVSGTGSGLIGIRERAASCGGTADLRFDGQGCTVIATLPLEGEAA